MPVINRTDETDPVPFPGDCHGGSIAVDITTHTDPAEWFEVEALASIDGGVTYPISLGSAGRWGGVSLAPVTGEPLTEMTIDTYNSLPVCTDPMIKVVTRSSNANAIRRVPRFSGRGKA